ncbi:MAG: hypothetical protein LQ340_000576 [Diploschistes diacapsis]|nr:MAG: hypothetical protein LQ340_000576 [Diploschistes diacapsis]
MSTNYQECDFGPDVEEIDSWLRMLDQMENDEPDPFLSAHSVQERGGGLRQTPQTTHLTPGPHINQSVGIHDTKARVPCLDCERTFGRRSEMLRHARKHNEALARSFKCPIPSCSKGFPRKDKLTAHMKSMHGPEVKGLVAAE